MNMRTVILFMLTLVIIASLARPQYLTSFNTVYSNGSCSTCHVNGASDGPRTAYGTLFENQPNHAADAIGSLRTIGAPPTTTAKATITVTATPTATPTATLTAIPTLTPIATLTPAATTTPTVTTVSATATPKAPGLGIVASIVGLFACALLVKRKNR